MRFAGGVPLPELAHGVLPPHEIDRGSGGLIVDRFHTLHGERARVLDGLPADLPEPRIST